MTKDIFDTGAQRDNQDMKPRPDLIDQEYLLVLQQNSPIISGLDTLEESYQAIYKEFRFFHSHTSLPLKDRSLNEERNILTWLALRLIRAEWPLPIGSKLNPVCNPEMLWRFGGWLGMGARHYGDNNWRKGVPYSRVKASLLRHILQWGMETPAPKEFYPAIIAEPDSSFVSAAYAPYESVQLNAQGQTDDHAAAILFNCMALWVYSNEYERSGQYADIIGV